MTSPFIRWGQVTETPELRCYWLDWSQCVSLCKTTEEEAECFQLFYCLQQGYITTDVMVSVRLITHSPLCFHSWKNN